MSVSSYNAALFDIVTFTHFVISVHVQLGLCSPLARLLFRYILLFVAGIAGTVDYSCTDVLYLKDGIMFFLICMI